jgi:uncharacterized membrane protein
VWLAVHHFHENFSVAHALTRQLGNAVTVGEFPHAIERRAR